MPELWTGEVVAAMHCNNISVSELAGEMGVTIPYMSMLLHSRKNPPLAEERVKGALNRLLEARNAEGKAGRAEARQS